MKKLLFVPILAVGLFLGCVVPSWVNTAEQIAQVVVPIAGSLVAVISPALMPLVGAVEVGFTALIKTLDAYKASQTATNLQAVQAAVAAVNANVAQLEQAAQIKNAGTASKVTAIVGLLSTAVTEIAALVPAPPVAAGAKSLPSGQAKGLSANDIKDQYNAIIAGDPAFAGWKQ